MAGEFYASFLFSPLLFLCAALLFSRCCVAARLFMQPWIIYPSSGPPWPSHMPTDSLLRVQAQALSHTALHSTHCPPIQRLSSSHIITHPRLYPPKTLQTALASTHAYKPAHTLFLPSSLFGAAPSPLSRFRLPLPVLDLLLSPRPRFSCLTAYHLLPHPTSAFPFVPLYPAQSSPAPSLMAGNGSWCNAMPPPESRRLRQQPALRAVVLLPSRH